MRIAIIGAGSVGATLGQAWLQHGEDVIWGLRNPADPKYAALPKQRVKAPAESVKAAEMVVIATPWSATQAAVKGLGSLAGKIVIDCTNPPTTIVRSCRSGWRSLRRGYRDPRRRGY